MAEKAEKKATTRKKPAAKASTGKSTAAKAPKAKKAAVEKKVAVKKAASTVGKRVRITLVRSVIGTRKSHRGTVLGLGLKRMHQTVELEDTPAVRGMINKVNYLLRVEA